MTSTPPRLSFCYVALHFLLLQQTAGTPPPLPQYAHSLYEPGDELGLLMSIGLQMVMQITGPKALVIILSVPPDAKRGEVV